MNTTKLSVIIPSYNSYRTIGYTLNSLKIQTAIQSIHEIIVVDSSDDGLTHSFLKEQEDGVIKVIRSGYKIMPAIQRNIGAKKAVSELLCFIDSDAFPAEDWAENILKAYDGGYRVGGGSYLVPEFQRKNKLALAQYYLEFNEYMNRGGVRVKRMLPTCNLFCEKGLFDEVGGIPEIRASEDTMFGLKVGKTEPVVFIPDARVYHIFRENKDHFLNNQVLLGKYIYVYRRFHYSNWYLKGFWPVLLYPVLMSVKFMRIFSRILRAGFPHVRLFLGSSGLFFKGLYYWGMGFKQGYKDYDTLVYDISLKPSN